MNEYTKLARGYLFRYLEGVGMLCRAADSISAETYPAVCNMADCLWNLQILVIDTIERMPARSRYKAKYKKACDEITCLFTTVCAEISQVVSK